MPKLKTKKCIVKRFRITKKGKVLKRKSGQDHFNARESSRKTMGKRRDTALAKTHTRTVKRYLPYS